jgi:transcription initiation factor TFIID subunit 2
VISALSTALVPNSPPERGELATEARTEVNGEEKDLLEQAVSEIVRYMNMDRLVPSAHNVVTIAALEVSFFAA